ncbi:hypothetical protein GYB61_05465 [bacterium]|nr:hypothetical protein [bacterium]
MTINSSLPKILMLAALAATLSACSTSRCKTDFRHSGAVAYPPLVAADDVPAPTPSSEFAIPPRQDDPPAAQGCLDMPAPLRADAAAG